MKSLLLKFSIIYVLFYLVIITIGAYTDLAFSSINLTNLLKLGIFILPIMPLIWFSMIRIKWLKTVISIPYCGVIIVAYAVSMLAIMFAIGDLQSGNGFRQVFESPLSNGERLVIYRSPDQGALGGDDICFATVKNVLPCIISRSFLSGKALQIEKSGSERFIIVEGVRIKIPDDEILRRYGKLY